MKSDKLTLTIEGTNGRPLRSFTHEGKTFIESHEDAVYQLRVKNNTSSRILAVIGVDGINIVSGNPVTDKPTETGYILGAHEEQVFKGYRVDKDTIAAFKFVKRAKSYATEKGEGQANGVIAVRVYEEKEDALAKLRKDYEQRIKDLENRPRDTVYIDRAYPVWPKRGPCWRDWEVTWGGSFPNSPTFSSTGGFSANASFGSQKSAGDSSILRSMGLDSSSADMNYCASSTPEVVPQSFDMGSSWGEAVKDTVREVAFEVGELLTEIALYYASYEALKSMGINVTKEKSVSFPEPFKREYAKPPVDWKG